MKKLLLIFLIPFYAFGHGGDDHTHAGEAGTLTQAYFSSEAVSEKYELFLKYEPITPGKETILRIFLSEFLTNRPVDSATLAITSREDKALKFSIAQIEPGYFEVKVTFPEAKKYSLSVNISAPLGPDLLLLQDVEPGKKLPGEEASASSSIWKNLGMIGLGLIAGAAIMYILMRSRYRRMGTAMLLLLCILPSSVLQPVIAHEGHDATGSGNSFANTLVVPKETQFLFDITTQRVVSGAFTESTKLFATVVPASNGQSVITSTHDGKVTSINVRVGEQVNKGDVLAVIDPVLDAGSAVNILTEKNNIDAEYEAARKEYERLKSIEDIAAKRDVAEAEARFRKARENKALMEDINNGRANPKSIILRAPIRGVVGNFTLAPGASVRGGEPLLTISNVSTVYLEAQVFESDIHAVSAGKRFVAQAANNRDSARVEARLVTEIQSLNTTNQARRVIFEINNEHQQFRIGEFVDLRVFAASPSRQISLPNTAINEINGRPVVFIKDHAEEYSISYLTTGPNNGTHTVVTAGVEEGERVVVNATYQMKMIYLNQ